MCNKVEAHETITDHLNVLNTVQIVNSVDQNMFISLFRQNSKYCINCK